MHLQDQFTMFTGNTKRFCCDYCLTEFTIILEPDYQNPKAAEAFGGSGKSVRACPFCLKDGNEFRVDSND